MPASQQTAGSRKTATARKPGGRRARNGRAAGGGGGVGGRADGRAAAPRQAELLQIAADMFAERGYAATTVREIADAAGILSGSLYHYFESKDSIVDEILSAFIDRMLASYDAILAEGQGPKRTFEQLVRVSLGSMITDRAAILIYQNEARLLAQKPRFAYLSDAHRKIERIWIRVIEGGIAEGQFRPSVEPKIVYRLVRDTVWTAPRWWRPGGPVKPEQIIEQYLAVLVDGISVHG